MANAFTVNLGIKDLQGVLRNFQAYDANTQEKFRSAVQASTANILMGAKRRAHVKSGDLLKNMSMSYDVSKNVGTVRAKSPHAHLVEYGAKAVTVKPKKGKALKIGDRFATSAHIPVRKERPFMRPAVQDEKPNLIKGIEAAVKP